MVNRTRGFAGLIASLVAIVVTTGCASGGPGLTQEQIEADEAAIAYVFERPDCLHTKSGMYEIDIRCPTRMAIVTSNGTSQDTPPTVETFVLNQADGTLQPAPLDGLQLELVYDFGSWVLWVVCDRQQFVPLGVEKSSDQQQWVYWDGGSNKDYRLLETTTLIVYGYVDGQQPQ